MIFLLTPLLSLGVSAVPKQQCLLILNLDWLFISFQVDLDMTHLFTI